jgi:hypothetical protein
VSFNDRLDTDIAEARKKKEKKEIKAGFQED